MSQALIGGFVPGTDSLKKAAPFQCKNDKVSTRRAAKHTIKAQAVVEAERIAHAGTSRKVTLITAS